MRLKIYQIDAFTDQVFKGNPAAVVPLESWLPDDTMQAIASENNLSETAFYVCNADKVFEIRWFSPLQEIDFCGHATLATAHVIFSQRNAPSSIDFWAKATGTISVNKQENGLIEMAFPRLDAEPVSEIPINLLEGLSIRPIEVRKNRQAYIAVYENEQQVRAVVPALQKLLQLGPLDVAITAPGQQHDFVSRYFWPASGGDEDPVTGSIHAALAPYWAERLGKRELRALQASRRSGLLHCRVDAARVYVSGSAVQYLEGVIEL